MGFWGFGVLGFWGFSGLLGSGFRVRGSGFRVLRSETTFFWTFEG